MATFEYLNPSVRPNVQDCECHVGYVNIGPCVPLPVIVDLEYLEYAVKLFRSLGVKTAYLRIGQPPYRGKWDSNWRATVLEIVSATGRYDHGRLLIAGIQPSVWQTVTWENERDGVLPEWTTDSSIQDWFARVD
jgi:hypothetical protein